MSSSRFDEGRDYGFADQALALRKRTGLTQRELGALLGVSEKAIGAWEAGLSYPAIERLQALIAIYLKRTVFRAGREEEEAAALWESVHARAPRRTAPFDPRWFAALRSQEGPDASPAPPAPTLDAPMPRHDWGEAPPAPVAHGREHELATLMRWVGEDHCRVVQVLGAGGIGKTTLAAHLAYEMAPLFAIVYWRSLRNAPPPEEWLEGAIAALSTEQTALPMGLDARLRLLIDLLRSRRALLVLDNLESLLAPGVPAGRFRAGYEGYGEVVGRLAASAHQSCVLLTSREPPALGGYPADEAAVRSLHLEGLSVDAGRALLGGRNLRGDDEDWRALVARYAGNPLALRMVGETIGAVFGGDIAAFLAQDTAVFGGIRQLLDGQVERLSALEQALLTRLAVAREPVAFADLVADLGSGVARFEAVEATEALLRRSLLEWGLGGAFTLQPMVLEHTTARLVDALAGEITAGAPSLLITHALLRATAREYVRRGQERLIAQPLLRRLHEHSGSADATERQLLALLEAWRGQDADEQGHGPGNVANLLRLLRGDLRGVDLSHLALRQIYLQGVEMGDASLAGAYLSGAVLDEAFTYPTAVSLSADGAYLAMGTATGEVALRRVADRTLLMAVQGHTAPVLGVALSADGRLLASGSFDRTVRLWEARSGRLLATMQGSSLVWRVALSADGRLVAEGRQDGTIRLWEVESGRLRATLDGRAGGIRGVALSADGRLLAGGGQDGAIRLWDLPEGRLRAALDGDAGGIWCVTLSADGRLLAGGGQDGTIRLWDATTGHLLTTVQGHAGLVWDVALSADGRLLAGGGQDGTIRLWETPPARGSPGRLLATMQGHTGPIQGVSLSADGRLLAGGSMDGTTRLWEVETGHLLATTQGQTGGIWCVTLSADGRLLASGGQDGTIRLWEVVTGHLLTTMQGHAGGIWGVALSADGRLLAGGGQDGTIRLWDLPEGRLRATLEGHAGGIWCVTLSADGRLLAGGGQDGTIRLWEIESGQLRATLDGDAGGIWGMALSADGRLVAAGGQDGMVRLWDLPEGRLRATLEGHADGIRSVALSADGRLLAGGGFDGMLHLWDATTGRLLADLSGRTGLLWRLALSADGRLLAGGSQDGTIRLWEVPEGRLRATLEGRGDGIRCVALSGDGRVLASGGWDGTVRLWNTASGTNLRTIGADRRYERLDITGLRGVTEAQRSALVALGAIDRGAVHLAGAPTLAAASPAEGSGRPAAVPMSRQEGPRTFAPAHSPGNLPTARTSFVGRTVEVAELAQALDPRTATGTRMLTLSGAAGGGKTRLALAAAAAVRDLYADGVWLVELAPLPASPSPDPTPVAGATLTALGLQERAGEDPLDTLIDYLQARRLLLVVDNCEHVAAACASLIPRLLMACPDLRILTTSQQALGIAGEAIRHIAPLALPPALSDRAPTPAELDLIGQADAIRLFVERARAVRPGFALNVATAANVAAICRRLDGLPLAIELAAARLHVLPVDGLLARLDDRFRLLRRGGRATTGRHQTLQATMDWSYGLLDSGVQKVLCRLAVFAGGWELMAAEVVCEGGEVAAAAVLEALDELLERSLVHVYRSDEMPRYGMLETVRHYGLLRLEQAGEAAAARDRHLDYFLALAEQAAPALLGAAQGSWLARLEREHDNLRAALQWSLDRGLGTRGLRLAAGIWQFWRARRGYLREGRRWLAALLALPADDTLEAMDAQAAALEGAAWLAEDEHDFVQAGALFARSAALRRAAGQDERTTASLINTAMEARSTGDYARATALLEQSLARHRALGDRESSKRGGLGLSLSRLALVLAEQGDHDRAAGLYEECLALHRELGDREGEGYALLGLGDIARARGDTKRMRTLCEETLTLFRELGHTMAGFSLNNLALADYMDGDLARATTRVEESESLFRAIQAEPSLSEVLVTAGRIAAARGEVSTAHARLIEALALAQATGPRWVLAAALEELGALAVRQHRAFEGVTLLAAAAALRQAMGTPVRPADRRSIERTLATARDALGDASFADAWAAGELPPPEQAVARAMDTPLGTAPRPHQRGMPTIAEPTQPWIWRRGAAADPGS